MKPELALFSTLALVFCLASSALPQDLPQRNLNSDPPGPSPRFSEAADGEFVFDTGALRGVLRPDGMSRGLARVTHIPSGQRLDRGHGLVGHYRVFANGQRFGGGAWEWPSQARLREDGSVAVVWPAAEDRPFTLGAVYRWVDPLTLDVETEVKANEDLRGFESFLASYFDAGFTTACAYVKEPEGSAGSPGFLAATRDHGDWLMFPRDATAVASIRDGRWELPPNPVAWTLMPELQAPVSYRQHTENELTVVFMASSESCFAMASPYQTESHYSLYLSLFGRDLPAGQALCASVRMTVRPNANLEDLRRRYSDFTSTGKPALTSPRGTEP